MRATSTITAYLTKTENKTKIAPTELYTISLSKGGMLAKKR